MQALHDRRREPSRWRGAASQRAATLSIGYEPSSLRRMSASPPPAPRSRPSEAGADRASKQQPQQQPVQEAEGEQAGPLTSPAGFFADDSVTFESLGAHPRVAAALQALGLTRPTRVQVSPPTTFRALQGAAGAERDGRALGWSRVL